LYATVFQQVDKKMTHQIKKLSFSLIAAGALAVGAVAVAPYSAEANGRPGTSSSSGTTTTTTAPTVYNPTGNSTVFDFFNIYPSTKTNESAGDPYVSYFKLKVEEYNSSKVLLRFINNSPDTNMFVGTVYIDDKDSAPLLTILNPTNDKVFYNQGEVSFGSIALGGNLPQGNKINFDTDMNTTADNGGGNKWAIQSNESLGILFGGSYNDVVSSFRNNTIAAGVHLQGITSNGYSDAFSTLPPPPTVKPKPVPLPPLALGLLVAAGWGSARLSRRNQKAAN
jgi:hypothetical protein